MPVNNTYWCSKLLPYWLCSIHPNTYVGKLIPSLFVCRPRTREVFRGSMKFGCCSSVIAILCCMMSIQATAYANAAATVNRINVGCFFRPVRDVFIETGRAHITFQIQLPTQTVIPKGDFHESCTDSERPTTEQIAECRDLLALPRTVAEQYNDTMLVINQHIAQINDRVQSFYGVRRRVTRRETRSFLARLTGLADGHEVLAL